MPDFRIQGGLNFGSVPAPGDYYTAYANALGLNQQNYNNILAGYQNLSGRVMSDIQGIDASQRQDITDQYTGELGTQTQRLIDRGLGNTTVQNAIQRGLLANRDKANIELTNKTQDLNARYRSQLGLGQLGFMERVNAPYPDVDQYNRVAMMGGAVGGRMSDPNYRVGQAIPLPGGFGGTRVNMPQGGGGPFGSVLRSAGSGAAGGGGFGTTGTTGGYFGGTGGTRAGGGDSAGSGTLWGSGYNPYGGLYAGAGAASADDGYGSTLYGQLQGLGYTWEDYAGDGVVDGNSGNWRGQEEGGGLPFPYNQMLAYGAGAGMGGDDYTDWGNEQDSYFNYDDYYNYESGNDSMEEYVSGNYDYGMEDNYDEGGINSTDWWSDGGDYSWYDYASGNDPMQESYDDWSYDGGWGGDWSNYDDGGIYSTDWW